MSKTAVDSSVPYRFSVAPMLDVTDRHARYFYRHLSQHSLLYTEMITTGAILHGDAERFLAYHPTEHPLALQLGGSDPAALAQCARIAYAKGYDEINLNVGCPSSRVQSGRFGACLMTEPELVLQCVEAMQQASPALVTVKCRLGVDKQESFEAFENFIRIVSSACSRFIVHARKAWLDGLSPKQNRNVPPLRYEWVYRIKALYPHLTIVINGGIHSLDACHKHLKHVDGVMLGREIQQNPMFLKQVDHTLFNAPLDTRPTADIIRSFYPYINQELESGTPLQHMTRHLVTFYKGVAGARLFRRHISENAHMKHADISVLETALTLTQQD